MPDEHWLDRAVEDKLGQVIDKYRAQGKDVHNVGRLRERVAADIQALRGTPQWLVLRQRYEPAPTNKMGWCRGCDKPISSGSVSAWLEDKNGSVWCSAECRDDPKNQPITWAEFKARVRAKGQVSVPRRELVDGLVVDGELITVTWDEIKNVGKPIPDEVVGELDEGIVWD